jgi:hypothetical protein
MVQDSNGKKGGIFKISFQVQMNIRLTEVVVVVVEGGVQEMQS